MRERGNIVGDPQQCQCVNAIMEFQRNLQANNSRKFGALDKFRYFQMLCNYDWVKFLKNYFKNLFFKCQFSFLFNFTSFLRNTLANSLFPHPKKVPVPIA